MKFKKILSVAILAIASCLCYAADYDIFIGDFSIVPGQTKDYQVDVYLVANKAINSSCANQAGSVKIELPSGFQWSSTTPQVVIPCGNAQAGFNSAKTVLTLGASLIEVEEGVHLYAKVYLTPSADFNGSTMTVKSMKFAGVTIANQSVNISALKEITIGEGGYSSFASYAPVEISSNGKVMMASIDGDVLKLTESGTTVPANCGVLIKGDPGATITLSSSTSSATGSSDLIPAIQSTLVEENSHLALATIEGETGFYTFTGTIIPCCKATLTNGGSLSPIRIEEGTNGIETIMVDGNIGFNYNLMGQQTRSQNGLIIEEGKKVMKF